MGWDGGARLYRLPNTTFPEEDVSFCKGSSFHIKRGNKEMERERERGGGIGG